MKDLVNPCHHCLSEDVVFKEVIVIGNGPSGIITSLLLSGWSARLLPVPDDLPLDPMLKARLEPHRGRDLLELDLDGLAEGLEGRSQNPVPLLMDNLLRPCADLGITTDPLVEWIYDVERQIDHVVLGKGPAGGAWNTFDRTVLTLSPSGWLALPPHSRVPGHRRSERVPAGDVASYYAAFVKTHGLQRYFRNGVLVTGITPRCGRSPMCESTSCPLAANWFVTGYDTVTQRAFRYACARVVLACGASDRPNTLAARGTAAALHDLSRRDRALAAVRSDDPVLVIGSGLSAADAVGAARRAGRHVSHAYRTRATALADLSRRVYPDYCEVYKMMRDGPSGNYENYTPLPEHELVEVIPAGTASDPGVTPGDPDDIASPKIARLVDLKSQNVVEIAVSVIFVLIGSKPDLHFLPPDFEPTRRPCEKCEKSRGKREERQVHFFKDRWRYIKTVVGQSIQSCRSRYWDLSGGEINGNSDRDCIQPNCKRKLSNEAESSGIGFAVDRTKPVDCRTNPILIDRTTHEVVNAPRGMYALGPLTGDNFVRFISGGAVAIVAHILTHRKVEINDDT